MVDGDDLAERAGDVAQLNDIARARGVIAHLTKATTSLLNRSFHSAFFEAIVGQSSWMAPSMFFVLNASWSASALSSSMSFATGMLWVRLQYRLSHFFSFIMLIIFSAWYFCAGVDPFTTWCSRVNAICPSFGAA